MPFWNGVIQYFNEATEASEKGDQEASDKAINQAMIMAQLSQAESMAVLADVVPEISRFLAILVGAEELTDDDQLGRTKADLFWVVQPLQDTDRDQIAAMSKVLMADESVGGENHRHATGEILRRALHAYDLFINPETAVSRNVSDEDNE